MKIIDKKLFDDVTNFEIGSTGDTFSFIDRLCRENGWRKRYAKRCFEEYKKFIYLMAVSDKPMTPSDEVDQVWHLHLTYTESYWNDLCNGILNKPMHHGPTKGGMSEENKFRLQYQRTLDCYVGLFRSSPPQDIWPSPEKRFGNMGGFVRLNKSGYVLLKKPRLKILVSVFFLLFLAMFCLLFKDNLVVVSGALILSFIGYITYRFFKYFGQNKKGNTGSDSGACGNAGCGGCGCG